MKFHHLLLAGIITLASSTNVFAKQSRDVASAEDDNDKSGIFLKIEGLDGHSGVDGYDNYFKAETLMINGRRENVTDKLLVKKDEKEKEKEKLKEGQAPAYPSSSLYVSFSRNFDPKSSLSLQKLIFSQKTTQVKVVLLSHGKVSMEYNFKDAFFSGYSVSHTTPSPAYGGTPDSESFDIFFSGYQATAPKTKETFSQEAN